ncbi:unnamed protein product (macronuclear) [Paramecium tetraurelia]|uniref:Transmembrane protein n=1 Tax=Paramecium tetraurelia TaxID=5888 RepID=A0BE00_PARTE|nr:uncharacterized protein GSPATT00027798001 [Paramecium tetraurelia]CAK56767.1 unnamed protein product [Paramecium tetraurelia]|eukprot:XP_001424165.1 hypothetical protein (macronuclear) [Paramecium tetraurelia strain d4-2]
MFINFQRKALKSLKKVDIFSQPVQLLIKSEEGHKTLFGACLTLGLISFFLYLLVINLYTLGQRDNPTSLTTEVYHAQPEYYKFNEQNFTLTFAIQSPDYATYIDESVYVVEAQITTKKTKTVDSQKIDEWTSQELPLTSCTPELIRQVELQEYFSHLNLPTNYCIDWNRINELILEGTFDSQSYSFIQLQFKMCNKQTKKTKECKSRDEIKQLLEQNYFSLQMSSYVVDVKNEEEPFKPKGEDIFTTISSKIFKEISFYMQPITVFTDLGLITEDNEIHKTLRYKRHTEMIDLNQSDLIMNVVIRLDQIEQQYYRSYTKIQFILSQMGGLWQVFFTIAFLIQKPINMLSYYVRILNSLFEFEQEKKKTTITQREDDRNQEAPQQELMTRKQLQSTREGLFVENKKKAFQRLQSIKIKKKQMEVIDSLVVDPQSKEEAKLELTKAISFSIKKYFQSISKKLKMKWTDYLYFISCFVNSKNYKSLQIEYSVKKIIKQMDILYIMKKLQEIDKLKMILLTESQIKVFDYLQKPTIPLDPNSKQFSINQHYYSILKPMKSDFQRAVDAQNAFKEIVENLDNPINVKLINSIDKTIVDLLKMRKNTLDLISIDDACISEQGQDRNAVLAIDIKQKHSSLANCQSEAKF